MKRLLAQDAKKNLEWLGLVIKVDSPGPPSCPDPNALRTYNPLLDDDKVVNNQCIGAGSDLAIGGIVGVVLVNPAEPPGMRVFVFGFGTTLLLLLIIIFLILRCCCRRTPAVTAKV